MFSSAEIFESFVEATCSVGMNFPGLTVIRPKVYDPVNDPAKSRERYRRDSADPKKVETRRAKNNERSREYRARIKADPEKYARMRRASYKRWLRRKAKKLAPDR